MLGCGRWSVPVAGLLLALATGCLSQDVFSEEAATTWLSAHHLMVHLRFDQGTTASRLHTSFPHAIQHLLSTLPLHDAELSLTSGRWRYAEWGWPLIPVKPVGAVLAASFHGGLSERALAGHWSALVHALSGLSCASLSLLRERSSLSGGSLRLQELPGVGLPTAETADRRPDSGATANNRMGQVEGDAPSHRLQGLLPHEPLCTENLTPWLRLLPCRDHAGLASLLRHRPTVFGAEYVSLGLMLERAAMPHGRQGLRLVQTFTFVIRAAPAPHQQPALGMDLEQALGTRVEHFCPAAFRSQVFVAVRSPAAAVPGPGGSCQLAGEGQGGRSCPMPGTTTPPADSGGDPDGSASSEVQAPQHGSLLVPISVAGQASSRFLAATGVSPVLPQLQVHDTLELLEVRGQGLGLSLPVPGGVSGDGSGAGRGPVRPGPTAHLLVDRYLTGAGLLRGGMVLKVQRSGELRARLADEAACAVGAAGAGPAGTPAGGSPVCPLHVLCVHQVFPWYVRPWMHTLAVLYDGQVVPLRPHLVAQHVQPAVQRTSLGVLDLCLFVPPRVAEVQLRVAFSKAFLTAFEYPPDAHRGFDIPAAVVSYLDALYAPEVQWHPSPGGDGGGDGGSSAGNDVVSSPLLVALSRGPVQQVFTPGLLVPLAAPDFSMPYNVLCLSSTVLAVYFGAVLNLLTRRGSSTSDADGDTSGGSKRGKGPAWAKALQVVAMLVLFAALALYVDAELRAQAEVLLGSLGIQLRPMKPGCGSERCH